MDPMSVLRTLWKRKWYVLPALLLTVIAAGYVFQYGPRVYESTASYALVNPDIPSDIELEEDPALDALNSNNPYLRSSNPSLIADVLITRLNSTTIAEALEAQGLNDEFTVAQGVGNGFVIDITGVGESPAESIAVTNAVAGMFVEDLRTLQTVSGAADTYLFTALPVASPDQATEQFSSRLRSVIAVVIAGAVLTFGAVSLAGWVESSRSKRPRRRSSAAAVRDDELDDDGRDSGDASAPVPANGMRDTVKRENTAREKTAPGERTTRVREKQGARGEKNAVR